MVNVGCRVLIFDEPTRGIDVVAKEEVLSIIRKFALKGAAPSSSPPKWMTC